jgi:hypothetical protein
LSKSSSALQKKPASRVSARPARFTTVYFSYPGAAPALCFWRWV